MMRESSALRPLFDAWRLFRLGLPRTIACGFIAALFVLVPTAHAATPVIGPPTITGTPGANGWYVSAVTVTYQVNVTSFSGVNCGVVQLSSTGFTGVITLSGDGANQDAQCTVTGGPTPASSPLFINIDTTPPTTTAVTVGRGPDMNGWYNHPVDVTATGTDAVGIASCTTTTYSGPDTASASVSGHCTDNAGNVSAPMTTSFPYDGTGPSISTSASRGPDANGWYNHPVDVTFSGSDGLSGMDSCAGGSYSGPDNGSASVSGSCRDKAGNTASGSFGLKYDATPPTVTGSTPDRPPNSDGWYNRPVVVTFAGSDAASGVASCTAQTYSGPNNPSATITGTCRDNAGNVSAAGSFPLKFDSTPPTLAGVKVAAVNTSVALTWRASHDVASLKITRTGGGSKGPRTVYSGKPTDRFMDRRVRSGDRYTYLITAYDPAGNPATARAVAILSAPLISPRPAATVHGDATLRWRADPKATYYNVQLWLNGKKVLSSWPDGPTLRLPHLAPGRYTWVVWPGLGSQSEHRYGPLTGKSTFVLAP
jgi:hypothetical protein